MTGAEFSSWESPEFIDNPDHVAEYFLNVLFPSNDITCGDSGMELGHESAGSAQDEARQSRNNCSTGENPTRKRQTRGSRGANKRRKRGRRPVSGNSREAKGIGILGESSSAFQQLESADGKEGLKPKILIDRVDRQINKVINFTNQLSLSLYI